MADSSVPGSVDVSDEVIEIPCSLCHDDGAVEEGVAYCTNCHDYLCRACLRVHRRIQASKDHKLLEGIRIRDALKYGLKTIHEICDKHKDKILDYFCLSHSELLCQDCKDFNHRRCRDVKSIDDVSKGLHGSQQAQRFLDDTNALIRDLKSLQQTRTGSLRQVEEKKKTCQDEVKSLRLIINYLDRLATEMQQEISRVSELESNSLNEQLATLATATKELEKDSTSLRDVFTSGGDRQVFIVIQRAALEKMKDVYEDLLHTTGRGSLGFEVDEKVKDLLERSLASIGKLKVATVPSKISLGTKAEGGDVATGRGTYEKIGEKVDKSSDIEETPKALPRTPSEAEHEPIHVSHVMSRTTAKGKEVAVDSGAQDKLREKVDKTSETGEISKPLPGNPRAMRNTPISHVIPAPFNLVQAGSHFVGDKRRFFGGDRQDCWITSALFLQDGRCILCDAANKKLKLLDPGLRLQSSVEMLEPADPRDIALLSENEAVVTLPGQKELQFVSVGRELKLGRTLDIGRECWGIAVFKSQLYVTCKDTSRRSGEVIVLDLNGRYLRRFGVNDRFTSLTYIAVDDEGRLFVSDCGMGTVTCISPAGPALYRYRDSDLQGPQQLLVDSDSNVFVCGQYSHTIQVISAKGRKLRNVLTARDGLINPYTLAYRSSDQTLVVGMAGDNVLSFRVQ